MDQNEGSGAISRRKVQTAEGEDSFFQPRPRECRAFLHQSRNFQTCLTSWQLLKDDEVEPEDGVLWDEPVPGSGSPTSPNAEKPDYEPKTKTEAEERALPFVRRERMVARMEGGYYCTFVHWKNEHVVGLFGGYAMFLDEQTLKVKKEWPRKHWCEPSVIVAEDNLFGIKTLYGGDHCKFSYSSTQSSNCPSNIRKVRYTDGSP